MTAFVECAGNGRSAFASQEGTPAPGTAWGLGAIGVARWAGVPLREILERAGVRADAVDVMAEGLDSPVPAADGTDQGHVRRPIPIAKALDDTLLALEMNGQQLPFDHGFPARLIVPGWVGIANIKWVGAIEVANTRLYSPWNTTQYRLVGPTYPADQPPLTTQPLKRVRGRARPHVQGGPARPAARALLVGRRAARSVRVSTDGGVTWVGARTPAQHRERLAALDRGLDADEGRADGTARAGDRPRGPPAARPRPVQPRRLPLRRHRQAAGHRQGLSRRAAAKVVAMATGDDAPRRSSSGPVVREAFSAVAGPLLRPGRARGAEHRRPCSAGRFPRSTAST